MAGEKVIASSVGTSTAFVSAVAHNHPRSLLRFLLRSKKSCLEINVVPKKNKKRAIKIILCALTIRLTVRKRVSSLCPPRRRSKQSKQSCLERKVEKKVDPKEKNKLEKLKDEQKEKDEQPESVEERKRKVEKKVDPKDINKPKKKVEPKDINKPEKLKDEQNEKEKDEQPEYVEERKEEVSGSADANGEHVEDFYSAENFINSVAANAGLSPSFFACGLNAGQWQVATGFEQVEIQVPFDAVSSIVGKGGKTARDLCFFSRARVELLQPNPSDGEQSKEWIVRITGGKKQTEKATQFVKQIMVLAKSAKTSPLSSGFSQQPKPRQSYSEWYKAKFDGPPRFTPYAQDGPTTHSDHGPPQDQYGKPRPQGPPPPAQPYGQQPRPNQPVEAQTYGQSMPPPQQQYPNAPSGPVQQTYPNPFAPANGGYGQTCSFFPPDMDNHAPPQQNGPQPTPYAQGGPTTHSDHGSPQDQYGKPRPQGPPPHAQPYGQQPRPNQPVEAQTYGQSMPPPQQQYPNAPSGPVQQTYPYPFAPANGGYGQTCSFYPPAAASSGYGQHAFPPAGPTGDVGLFPVPFLFLAPVYPAAFGAPPQHCWSLNPPAAAYAAQPTQARQPGYDQSDGYDDCSSRSSVDSFV